MPGNVVSVDGKENRTAGRDYIELKVTPDVQPKQPLVRAQRRELKSLVDQVASECEREGFVVWRALHAQLAVHNIKEVTRDQFPVAQTFLNSYRREHRDQQACRELVEQINGISRYKSIDDEVERFCTREFGQLGLGLLSRGELMRVLAFADDYRTVTTPQRFSLPHLVRSYPAHAATLMFIGFCIGLIF